MLKRESDERRGQVVQSLYRVHVDQQQAPIHVKERVRREERAGVQSLYRVHVGQQQVPIHVKERVRREERAGSTEPV
jgi:hypothetical protein